jgi:NADH-quinone oxidoreductase subunit H
MDSFELTITLVKCLLVAGAFLGAVPYLVFAERKICAFIQDRVGPNRVGPFGLLQPLADGLKLLFKEDMAPRAADRLLFSLGPLLTYLPAISGFAIIPFGRSWQWADRTIPFQIADPEVGFLYFFALNGMAVYGLALGGWASNNKYSLLGGLRASAQVVSYEIALVLAFIGVFLHVGSLSPRAIVAHQAEQGWNLLPQWFGFLIFAVSALAENNRLPFDLPEAEAELVGGYHTEYSSMRFGLFFLAEYAGMITMSAILVTLYLGGWHWPGMPVDPTPSLPAVLASVGVFLGKVALVLFVYIWTRWTLPRFRYDQLMSLGWKGLIPLALLNLVATALFKL